MHLPIVGPPVDDATWQDGLAGPDSLRQALAGAKVAYFPGPMGSTAIPVRIFAAGGSKTPVVLTHGLQSHSGWFAQSAAFLAGMGYPVYALDRKGSGLSGSARGDVKHFQEWVEEIDLVAQEAMRRHGTNQFYLVGHCFGAIPATAYAAIHPNRLKGLILTSPALYTKTSLPFGHMLKIFLSRSDAGGFTLPLPLEVESFSELSAYQRFIAQDRLSLKEATGDFYLQVHKARKFIESHIGQLRMPFLMMLAGADPICDNHLNARFFNKIPTREKTMVVFGGARHILEMSSEQKLFFDMLAQWLANNR